MHGEAENPTLRTAEREHILRLRADHDRWHGADQQRERREAEWQQVARLLRHAEGLPIALASEPAVAAIRDGRLLLDEPDPVTPLLEQLTGALRSEIKQRAEQLADAQRGAVTELESWTEWTELEAPDRETLIADAKLLPVAPPDVATDAKLLEALDAASLTSWQERTSFIPSRRDQVRHQALEKLKPESVRISMEPATITDAGDLKAYLEDVRSRVQPQLDAGKTVIL